MFGGKSVLKVAAITFMCLASSLVQASEKIENKSMFYAAMFNVSREEAEYVFMLDQLLEMRCGKSQSLESLKKSAMNRIYVSVALKDGKADEAKRLLNSVQCER